MIALAVLLAVAAPPKVVVENLSDGTELVFVRVPGAEKTSLRFVIRSGGAADPPGMTGLAHLLEHLIFHGSYDVGWDQIWHPMHKAGATLNAFTSPDYTYYVLDAPAATFRELAARYLEVITNPALMIADLEHERGVVSNEGVLRNSVGMVWIVDQLLFSGVERGATVLGTRRTRDNIQRKDLINYYATNYVSTNATAIIVGDLELEEARRLIEESSRLPPALPEERVEEKRGEVNLPVSEKTFAPYDITAIGYELAGVDRPTCWELASLLELRVMVAVQIERPLASEIAAYCARLRGRDFLLLFTESRSFEGGALPDVLRSTFVQATKQGPSAKEREILKARGRHVVAARVTDPAALAEALVPEVAIAPRPSVKRRFDAVLAAPKLDPGVLLKAAKSSFRESRRVEIRLSPFGT